MTHETDDDRELCVGCLQPLETGQRVIREIDGGFVHMDCCGDDGSFVDQDDAPIPPGAPRPEGFIWSDKR